MNLQPRTRKILLTVALGIVGASVCVLVTWQGTPARAGAQATHSELPPTAHIQRTMTASGTGTASPMHSALPASDIALPSASSRQARRNLADQLRQQLIEVYGTSTKPADSVAKPDEPHAFMPRAEGSGNQADKAGGKYVQRIVREQFIPVAASCYEQLLERDANAAGEVVLDFSVVGSPELGGVVELVEVDEQATTLHDEDFITCVRESMYTTMFDAPPPGASRVTISYPFSFAP